MKPLSLSFPKDELKHDSVIEWWYFNGNLRDDSGRQYALMYCLFKADPQKVKLPFLDKMPSRDFYFSHCLVADINKRKSNAGTKFLYEGVDSKSFSKDFLFVKAKDFFLEENPLFQYKIKSELFDLRLVSKKEPLLLDGKGWIDLKSKDTYYYSLTNLEAKGEIIVEGKLISVSGKLWMDHQWADNPYSPEDKWNWFSLQLDNDIEILCFEYGDVHKTRHASILYPDGRQESASNVKFIPGKKKWKSPATQAIYNVEWKIEIPELNMNFEVISKIDEQEVIFASINYWEGAIVVSGDIKGVKISGQGFSEMVGVPMGKSVARVYIEEAKKMISNYFARP